MDSVERLQIANVSRILAQMLDPPARSGAAPPGKASGDLGVALALREVIAACQQAVPFLPSHNPGWRILLELYIAGRQQSRLSVSDIWHVTDLPNATSLRWLRLLEDKGMVKRHPDHTDRRRFWLHLTDSGTAAVAQVIERATERLAPVVDLVKAW